MGSKLQRRCETRRHPEDKTVSHATHGGQQRRLHLLQRLARRVLLPLVQSRPSDAANSQKQRSKWPLQGAMRGDWPTADGCCSASSTSTCLQNAEAHARQHADDTVLPPRVESHASYVAGGCQARQARALHSRSAHITHHTSHITHHTSHITRTSPAAPAPCKMQIKGWTTNKRLDHK